MENNDDYEDAGDIHDAFDDFESSNYDDGVADSFSSDNPQQSEQVYNTFDVQPQGEQVEPFDENSIPKKEKFDEKPGQLNKQFIIAIIISSIAVFFIFTTFLLPLIRPASKKTTEDKPKAVTVSANDYSNLIPFRKDTENAPFSPEREAVATQEDILESLPSVSDKYQPKPVVGETPYKSSSTPVKERPDTSADALQSKRISGIKGISPTQQRYADGTLTSNDAPQSQQPQNDNPYARFGLPSKADYTQQMVSAYGQSQGNGGYAPNNTYLNQNDQGGKQNFYNSNKGTVSGSWLASNSVWQGTIFEAELTSDINTDLPGECTAIITKNVYSSQDGSFLLIPQQSKLYGTYNSSISYSQKRVQVAWHTLIRPDGYMQNLGNMSGTDAKGASGLKGFVNEHPFQYIKAILLMSVFNIINSEFQNTQTGNDNEYVQNIIANGQQVANTLGSKLIDRAMDVQPTITIRSGKIVNIVANMTFSMPPIEPYDVVTPYRR